MYKAKIVMLGPCESGKSMIANFLADATETTGGMYKPTQALRIMEFEVPGLSAGSRSVTADVELWDCSGDTKFEACWPAIARDTNGIVFVFNPEQPNHDKELEKWHEHFVMEQGIRESNCILFAHTKTRFDNSPENLELPSSLARLHYVHTNLEDDSDSLRRDFNSFLSTVLGALSDKREQEENTIIMNQR